MSNTSVKDTKTLQLTDRSAGVDLKQVLGLPVTKLSAGFKAKNFYAKKHNQPGLQGLQETVKLILDKGCFHQDGNILVLWSQGYRVVIALDYLKIINYDTIHHQRTLAEVRAGVPSKAKGSELNHKQLINKLDDTTIDRIKIPYKIVKDVQEQTNLTPSEIHDLLRDSIADALDVAEKELEDLGDELFLTVSTSYSYVAREGHLLKTDELDILLRKDGLRIKEVTVKELDLN